MKKNTVHYVLLLDKSGSMSGIEKVTISGANDVIKTIQEESKEHNLNATLTFSTFDDNLHNHLKFEEISKVGSIAKYYNADGGTAIGKSIIETLKDFSPPANDRVCFILFTDGQDGCYRDGEVNEIISMLPVNKYTFVYIGPGYIERSAKSLGFRSCTSYETTTSGTRAVFSKIARAMKNYIDRVAENFNADFSDGFFTNMEKKTLMTVNGLSCVINTPKALKSKKKDADEESNTLPPYDPIDAYVVDEYPACPANWMHGSSKASSYFIPVEEDRGMWIDLNPTNTDEYEYYIAAVISVQGVNPITGQRTDVLNLQQYKTKCPVHDVEFQQDRFCPSCNFKWPAQNYISSNVTPEGYLWLDGFRSEDGKVRQYVFTEDEARGVAANIIGKDRVFAIGIAFYRSKAKKPKKEIPNVLLDMMDPSLQNIHYTSPLQHTNSLSNVLRSANVYKSHASFDSCNISCASLGGGGTRGSSGPAAMSAAASECFESSDESLDSMDFIAASMDKSIESIEPTKTYEVGAGAKIDQQVHPDTESLEFWSEEPIGMLFVNYSDLKTVRKILKAGKRIDKKEGFLEAVAVGN